MRRYSHNMAILLAASLSLVGLASCGTDEPQSRLGPNASPIAVVDLPVVGITGQPVLIDASQSSDSDGFIAEYHYSAGDSDETVITGDSALEHTYDAPGNYTVRVTVVDDRGASATTGATISIEGDRQNSVPEGTGTTAEGTGSGI
ncbi:MAG: PKD domain-containing protein [Myxococcales bacterium]|nr:PKD domain-containing protein [Myxococcales bacterium]